MEQSISMKSLRAAAALAVLCAASGCGDDASDPPPGDEPPTVEEFMTGYFETFDSYATGDILALYREDVSAEISGLGQLEGKAEVRDKWLTPFTTAFPDYTHTVNELTVEGNVATADFVFRGTHQAPLQGYEPTGKELVLPIVGTYTVEESAVTHFTLEYDLAVVLAAITP
jgi:predicted ester cyclase